MQSSDLYSNAHLVVAAIRIFTHKNSRNPSLNEICKTLAISLEQGNLICQKLKGLGIIDVVEGAFENHLFIKDHLKIEEISKDKKEDKFRDALKKFKDSRKDFSKEIESFQAKQAEKQKALFSELEERLKKGSDKTNHSPE
jgi:DNA-binding transcriptional MocR family regulator